MTGPRIYTSEGPPVREGKPERAPRPWTWERWRDEILGPAFVLFCLVAGAAAFSILVAG